MRSERYMYKEERINEEANVDRRGARSEMLQRARTIVIAIRRMWLERTKKQMCESRLRGCEESVRTGVEREDGRLAPAHGSSKDGGG